MGKEASVANGILFGILFLAAAIAVTPASAAPPAKLKVTAGDFANNQPIPASHAFCVLAPADQGHFAAGPDRSPKLSWSAGPKQTQSYAVLAFDRDVPVEAADANVEGKLIPVDARRRNFYHWVMVDIPASITTLEEAADSAGIISHGKVPGPTKLGFRGVNDFTKVYADVADMKGNYGGYDGPCPPWNDMRLHHYKFWVLALDIPSLKLKPTADGETAAKAMARHIVGSGEIIGTYSLNPTVIQLGRTR